MFKYLFSLLSGLEAQPSVEATQSVADTTSIASEPDIPDVADLTIERIRQGLDDREFTCLELCEVYLARIAEVNDELHVVIQTNPAAKATAASRDDDYKTGAPRGALHGIPILVKNVFHVNDKMLTTAGSLALAGSHGEVSTAVTNLEREGAIILGTTNLSEFANLRSEHCPDGWSALGGQCYGAYAKNHNPSGSSSGSAVGARIGLAAACLGTENNGSITSPAAQAACVGFKPTVGLISRRGIISFNEYQDCPGTLSRTVEDAARVVSVMAGRDAADPITNAIPDMPFDVHDACKSCTLEGVRLAVPRLHIAQDITEPEILASFDSTLNELRKHGATIVDFQYPTWNPDFSRQTLPFVWSQLKTSLDRYLSCLASNPHNIQSLSDLWKHMHSLPAEQTGKLGGTRFVKALNGPALDAEEVFAARLAKGSEIATVLAENECDVIVVPEGCRNPADLGQCPVICLPMGFYSSSVDLETDEYGLTVKYPNIPFGIMMIGRKWDDRRLCAVAAAYERVIRPKIYTSDKPAFMPKTELRHLVKRRLENEEGVVKPQL